MPLPSIDLFDTALLREGFSLAEIRAKRKTKTMTTIKQIKEQILEKIGNAPDANQAYAWAQCYREMTNAQHNEKSLEHWQTQTEGSNHPSNNTLVRAEQAASADAEVSEASAV